MVGPNEVYPDRTSAAAAFVPLLQAELRAQEEAERQKRGGTEARREEPARPAHAPAREKTDFRATEENRPKFGARQELHIAGDVSARHKKKKRLKARTAPADAEPRHGFEKPTFHLTGWIVVVATFAFTLLVWIVGLAVQ